MSLLPVGTPASTSHPKTIQKILETLVEGDPSPMPAITHDIKGIQLKYAELAKDILAKAKGGQPIGAAENENVSVAVDLMEISQKLVFEANKQQIEVDKLYQNNATESAKHKADVWAYVQAKQVEITKAMVAVQLEAEKFRETMYAAEQDRELKKQEQDFRQKMEANRFAAELREREFKNYVQLQQLKGKDQKDGSSASADQSIKLTSPFLHQAATLGNVPLMQSYLEAGFDISELNDRGDTPLACAIRAGHLDVAKLLYQKGVKKSFRNKHEQTYLHLAVKSGKKDMVAWVYSWSKTESESLDRRGNTPLALAVRGKHLDIAQFLVNEAHASCLVRDKQVRSLLHLSVSGTDPEMTKWLLSLDVVKKNLLHSTDAKGLYPIQTAVLNGQVDHCKELVNQGAKLHVEDKQKRTLMHLAAEAGCCEMIEWLNGQSEFLSIKDSEGKTPVASGVANGNTEAVRLLLQLGADKDVRIGGNTLLHLALPKGTYALIDLLLQYDSILEVENDEGHTPLQLAVLSGRKDLADYLYGRGASLNRKNNLQETPLHLAVKSGNVETVQWVKGLHPDLLDITDNKGFSPLATAVSKNHEALVKLLLDANANTSLTDKQGRTLLHLAVDASEEVLALLLTKSGYLEIADHEGNTPLQSAVRAGKFGHAKKLADKGAKIDVKNLKGETLLHAAAYAGHAELMTWLLEPAKKLDKESPEKSMNATPLACAVKSGHADSAQKLMDAGAKIDVKTNQGETLLHLVCADGPTPLYVALLDQNLDPNSIDAQGQTPLQLAVKNGKRDLAIRLLQKGADKNILTANKENLIHLAALNEQGEMIDWLVQDCKLNIEAKDQAGYTPLARVVMQEQFKAADMLHKNKADLNCDMPAPHGLLVHYAVESEKPVIIRWMRSKGYKIFDAVYGIKPMELAVQRGKLDMAKCIAENHPEPVTAYVRILHLAAEFGQSVMIGWLVGEHRYPINHVRDGETALVVAVKNNKLEAAKKLHQLGASLDVLSAEGQPLMHVAAALGHKDMLAWLSSVLVPLETKNNDGYTPLQWAVLQHQTDAADKLIELGADSSPTVNGETLLHLAVASKNEATVTWAYKRQKKDIAHRNAQGYTPLQQIVVEWSIKVAKHMQQQFLSDDVDKVMLHTLADAPLKKPKETEQTLTDLIDWLIATGYSLDARDSKGLTPLQKAVCTGNLAVAKALRKKVAADVVQPMPLLHLAAAHGQTEMIEWLLQEGANINQQSASNRTPIDVALDEGQLEAAKMLVAKNAALTPVQGNETYLHKVLNKGSLEMLKWTLTLQKEIDALDNSRGWTPLQKAVWLGRIEHAACLKEAGAAVRAVTAFEQTLLHLAAASENQEMVKWVYDLDKDQLNMKDAYGRTPFWVAVEDNRRSAAAMLIRLGADKETRNHVGDTPLIAAAKRKDSGCVEWLLDQGCDPSCQDAQGKEALVSSIESGDEPTVKLLAGRSPMARKEMLNSAIRSRQGKIMEWLLGQFSLSAQEALFQAIDISSLDCAKRLIKPGVVYDATDLLSRISLSEKDMVEWCLTLAPDINRTNHAGRTFIQESVRGGHLDAAKLIADKNPTLDLTAMKENIVHLAVASRHLPTVEWAAQKWPRFLEHRDSLNHTPLIKAMHEDALDIAKELQKQSGCRDLEFLFTLATVKHLAKPRDWTVWLRSLAFSLDTVDKAGYTLIQRVVMSGNQELAELLRVGSNIDSITTPLPLMHLAAAGGHCDMISWLQGLKLPVDQRIGSDRLPLTLAVEEGHLDAAKLLHEQFKAPLPAGGEESLLHKAVKTKSLALVSWVVTVQAELDCVDVKEWLTPLQLATMRGLPDIVLCLINKGAKTDRLTAEEESLAHLAVRSGSLETLQKVASKQMLERIDRKGRTPRALALELRQDRLVTWLEEQR